MPSKKKLKSDKIQIELTRREWVAVIEALNDHAGERMNAAAMTNNERHAKAWERQCNDAVCIAEFMQFRLDREVLDDYISEGR